jgi:hypothetical protein
LTTHAEPATRRREYLTKRAVDESIHAGEVPCRARVPVRRVGRNRRTTRSTHADDQFELSRERGEVEEPDRVPTTTATTTADAGSVDVTDTARPAAAARRVAHDPETDPRPIRFVPADTRRRVDGRLIVEVAARRTRRQRETL